MPCIKYVNQTFTKKSRQDIDRANQIITQYEGQGFRLTLRQLYYQFVSRGFIANSQKQYKRLGDLISKARLAGLVDWTALEDRTRGLMGLSHWNSPADILEGIASQYNIDKWATQPRRVAVWIEKDALTGVIAGVCNRWDVPFLSCRGYTSSTTMWEEAQRLREYALAGKRPVILHFGDHDPSGLDMTRDITERQDLFQASVEIRRLALNIDQVRQYNPPPNPAKETDSRFGKYAFEHGSECWELDALEPTVIASLIEREIKSIVDMKAWNKAVKRETTERARLAEIAKQESK